MREFFSKRFHLASPTTHMFSTSSYSNSKNASSSPSSSSSSSSPCESPLNCGGPYSPRSKKRLMRQRKIRHLTGVEIGLGPSHDRSKSLPVSPVSRSRSSRKLGHWSLSAVPQPLPLPKDDKRLPTQGQSREEGTGREGNPFASATGSSISHQSIMKTTDRVASGSSKSPTYHRRRGSPQDLNVESVHNDFTLNVPARSAPTSTFSSPALSPKRYSTVDVSHPSIMKTTNHVATGSSKSPTCHRRRGFPQDLNVESVHNDFTLNVPARSAPTSTFSSPALSPKKYSTVDVFYSPFVFPQESSASEVLVFDRLTGSASPVVPARVTPSCDRSPLHGPTLQNPCRDPRSPTYVSMHSNNKSATEIYMARSEGSNANVHPLPLPPGVSRPSQSTSIRHIMDKSDASSIKGQWQKGKLIGRGTYGSVYEATNRETGRLCAMKEVDIIPEDSKSAECIRQLEQEIKVLQCLEHPNIVQYLGSEIVEDRFCIYLEHIYPGCINKYVREHFEAMTESVVRNFTRHILSGLAYLHSMKTIHRDIKGANLLVDASGVIKIADFGLAKHLAAHTIDLSLKGSPHWMAPEVLQAMMRKDANPEHAFAVDIWSLGCTVIEMLTGKPPWSEFNGVQAMFNVLNRSPPIPETLSSEGKDFLRWCLQRNPANRPSAAMLLDHPFLRNSLDHNISVCKQEFSGLKLNDISHSQRDWIPHHKDLLPHLSSTWIRHGKFPSSCGTSPQSCTDASDYGAASRHSPCSTLEVLPSISSTELNCSSHNISLPNISNRLHMRTGSDKIYSLSTTPGREIPHM